MPCQLQPWEVEIENAQYQKRNNKERYGYEVTDHALLTGLLCDACKIIDQLEPTQPWPQGLKEWWEDHQLADKVAENLAILEADKKKKKK